MMLMAAHEDVPNPVSPFAIEYLENSNKDHIKTTVNYGSYIENLLRYDTNNKTQQPCHTKLKDSQLVF